MLYARRILVGPTIIVLQVLGAVLAVMQVGLSVQLILAGLRALTTRYQIPLIFDEVVTGFRFAYGGAQEYYGVVPDLCALGKIIGGGFPLAAVAGRREIMKAFDPRMDGTPDFFIARDKPSKQWWVKWRTSACWTRGFKSAAEAMRSVELETSK